MFLVNSLVRGKGCGRGHGKAGGTTGRTGRVVCGISAVAISYNPEPPPPLSHVSNAEANESDEIRQFRKQFAELSGDKMEISASELMDILNQAMTQHSDLKTDCLGIHTCRSMVAVMDSETSGKLGFEEFKYLWKNVKKWQAIYKEYVKDLSRTIGLQELPAAFVTAGFQLNPELYQVIVRRYSDDEGSLDFNDFICCLVRLDSMFRAFKSLEKDGSGQICLNFQEWLQLTLYS
ncbi:calpain small subunit 1-like [Dromiciops gliroides]|uniref:calpain small subunit 1-like n=1 Tax=Dromiciops gliroides TaxID=33562 RepID=UPI001CC4EC26|nr:calpain small subunit 1-like [Dromiciops gliroides]